MYEDIYVCTCMYVYINTRRYIKYIHKTNVPTVNASVPVFSLVSPAPHVSHTYREDEEDEDDMSVYIEAYMYQ